jgi:hypothetical protein
VRPKISETTNRIRNSKNRIFAIEAAVPATPKNPKAPAINAITRKVNAQLNIGLLLSKVVCL